MSSDDAHDTRGAWHVVGRVALVVGLIAGVIALIPPTRSIVAHWTTHYSTVLSTEADVTEFIDWLKAKDGERVTVHVECPDDSDDSVCHHVTGVVEDFDPPAVEVDEVLGCRSTVVATRSDCDQRTHLLSVRIPESAPARLGLAQGAYTWLLTGTFMVTYNGTAGFIGYSNFDLVAVSG
jgi:hypothetical protein